jgi:hypothetical protein
MLSLKERIVSLPSAMQDLLAFARGCDECVCGVCVRRVPPCLLSVLVCVCVCVFLFLLVLAGKFVKEVVWRVRRLDG